MNLKQIHKDKKYLLAVSGGVDSMVMCDLFLKTNVKFAVSHCNFQLRNEASDLDEDLVKSWCIKNDISCYVKKMDTLAYVNKHNTSIQVAARELRYGFFNELLNVLQFDFIATAHHQDDTIETVLFHFFRGTGIQGMTGIPAVNGNVIRPMLHCEKIEIIEYANSNKIAYRDDASNKKNDYTRNKLRNIIIPQLEEFFPGFKNNMSQNIVRLNEVNEIYSTQINVYKKKFIEQRGKDFYIPILKLKLQHTLSTILYELLKPFQFSFDQSQQVLQMIDSQTGSIVENEFYRIIKNRNFFILTEKNTKQTDLILIETSDKKVELKDFDLKIVHKEKSNFVLQTDESYCQVDFSQLEYPLLLRKWREGDYMYPLGMDKKKKIARILIDAKVPLNEKENCWVLESNKKIVWLVGMKIDNRFKYTKQTNKIVEFTYKKRNN
jgi:tRNA(Ile)-lysidine synthase